ncbi:MAG: FimV/HubP family polar landmark protein [Pseudomonadales bacterium]
MLRSAVRTIGLTGALFSSGVFALGLGDMKLFSAVNEPLRAEIKLLKVGDLNTTQVLVKLASMQDFDRANVDREFFLTGMRYEVVLDGRGGGVVKVSTEDPVREPYLNFLLEAKWPSGRLIREYTLLLDLPAFTSTSSADSVALQAPQSAPAAATDSYELEEPLVDSEAPIEPVQSQAAPAVAATPPRQAVQRESEPQPQRNNSDRYTTERSDTLWEIAQQVRPSDRVTVNQTMIALQEDNPEAFINGNINRLKVGQVLRIPDEQRVRDVANSQAQLEVARQMQEWRSGDDDIRQLDARAGAAQPAPAASSDTRGTLTLSTAGGAGVNGDPDGSADEQVNSLNARLTDVMAELSSTTAENDELSSRVQNLLSEMEDLKNKLEVRNSQLAQLQAQGATDVLDQEFDATPDAVVTPESDVIDDADAQALAASDDFASDVASVDEALAEEPEPAAKAPAAAPIKQPGFFDKLFSPLWAGLVAGLLALVALFFWWRKRSNEDEFEFEPHDAAPSVANRTDHSDTTNEAIVPSIGEDTFAEAEVAEDTLQDSAGIEAEMGDPVAEADIYVAYGRYPQAVDLLNRAIEQEPDRTDLVAKLVEVHSAAGDREAAATQLAKLESMGSGGFDALAEDASDVYATTPEIGDEPAPDVMEEFRQTLPEETAMDFSEEFTDEPAPIDESFVQSILGEEEDVQDEAGLSGAAVAAVGGAVAAGAALLSDDDEGPDDDGLSFDNDFDLELELDDEVVEDLDPGDVRDAFATGNELQDGNFSSNTEVEMLDSSPEAELLADFAELEDQPVAGIEAGLADIDDSMADAAVINELDALSDIQLDLDSDNDMDIESELSSFDISIGDEVDTDIENADLSALELELEQSSLDSDDDAQRAADIAMLESDETATKLDLARAYIDMGDNEGARDILGEVLDEGTALDKQQAKELIDKIA